MMKIMNKIWVVLAMCFAIAFFLIAPQGTVLAVDPVSLDLRPSSSTVSVNGALDVEIKFTTSVNRVLGLSFRVNFDKSKLILMDSPFDARSNTGFTAYDLTPNNRDGFFDYHAIGDPANVARGEPILGTLRFKAIATTDAGATANVTFPLDKIIAGSANNPLLPIVSNQNNLKGTYTITPAAPGTECPANITSTEAKLQSGETWSTEKTITVGQTVKVAGFHNGRNSPFAADTLLRVIGPEGRTSRTRDLTGNNVDFRTDELGRYTITATTEGKTGQNCTGSAILTVTAAQVTTDKFRWAFDRSAFTDALPWQDYTEESRAVPITFPADMPPGVKQIWVEFKDSTGRVSRQSTPIKLLGAEPAITGCSLNFEGSNVIFNIRGTNFGAARGTGKSNETNLQVRDWRDTSLKLIFPNAPVGQSFPISLTNGDGQIADGLCAGSSTVSLGAKVFCRAPAQHDTDAVEMILAGGFEGGKKAKETVRIDRNGVIQNLTQKLEEGKKYKISLKAPKSLRKVTEFTASSGTTNIPNFTLPVGDIFPADGGDGKINTFDKTELNRQWIIGQASTSRSGDFNQDGRVNAIDWACMRQDFGKEDESEPSAGGPAASPAPSASPVVSPSPSPSG